MTHFTALLVEKYFNPWHTSLYTLKTPTQLKETFVIKIMKLCDTYL